MDFVLRPAFFRTFVATLSLAAATGRGTETIDGDWLVIDIATGVTPAFDFDPDDRIHLIWFTEDAASHGPLWIATADNAAGPFDAEVLTEGYFYGTGDVLAAPDGAVHVFWHDHLGTPRHVIRTPGGVSTEHLIDSPGTHDGWDSSLGLDSGGRLHASSLFPVLHGATTSLEYGVFDGTEWTYDFVDGSGLSMYGLNTSLVLDSADHPHILYCRAAARDLPGDLVHVIGRAQGWEFSTIVEGGLRGRFPTLALDDADRSHAAWLDLDEPITGRALLRYGVLDGEGWEIETVTTLENIRLGFCDSRRPVSLVLDGEAYPQLAFCDARRVTHAVRSDTSWEFTDILESSADLYMGVAHLELDSTGNPTVALWQLGDDWPTGLVRLATLRTGEVVFHRGDPDDSGATDISDAVNIFSFLFLGADVPSCRESADANNSGAVDISDGVTVLDFLFNGGPPPPAPGPTTAPCGPDPDAPGSPGDLGCDSYSGC